MVGACVGVFVMAMLFEALRTFRERLRSRSRGDSKTSLISQSPQWTSALMDPSHLVQTMLYGLQVILSPHRYIWDKYVLVMCIRIYILFTFNYSSCREAWLVSPSKWMVYYVTGLYEIYMVFLFLMLLQITLGYLLMLIFMTYNVYICLAVVSGATLGFWLFSWRKCPMFDITVEHCG